jgi:hypothetical protein
MIDNCLLQSLPQLRSLQVSRRGLDQTLTMHFHHGSRDEVIARVENFLICKAAFEKALFVYPDAHLEMRQGARINEVERGTAPAKLVQ